MNRTLSFVLSSIAVAVLATSSVFAQTQWNLDRSHSNIKFSVKHLVVSEAEGKFKSFTGTVASKDDSFDDAQISFTIDVASIDSDDEKRDGHLKGDDFFAADKYPQIKFVGKSFKKVAKGKYKLTGDLTMRDVTKTAVFDVDFNGIAKDPWGNIKAGFKATTVVNRLEYGLKWNTLIETGGAVVGKDVTIVANIELAKPKA
jgi:polyisoprenoid-binding protein YceI